MMILQGFFEDSVTNCKGSLQGTYKEFPGILQGFFRIWKRLLQEIYYSSGNSKGIKHGGLNKEF